MISAFRASSRNLGQSSILARKGTFFMKKGHQKFPGIIIILNSLLLQAMSHARHIIDFVFSIDEMALIL